MKEIWRDTLEFPDLYQASSKGRVRNKTTRKVLSQWLQKPGSTHRGAYLRVTLTVKCKPVKRTVHCLVAEAFLGARPSPEHECRHKDGNLYNCWADNLLWGTRLENLEDKRVHGTLLRGEKIPGARLNEQLVREMRQLPGSHAKIAKKFGVHRSTVRSVVRKLTWGHV